ncbi:peptidylprolyl isomerase [bacterium (Candidatus Blackallbacteria) CG17_big_fil_post_rev_8_21_14_2_50_48_46]|uniref:Peptidyl-prolyl cis-trans isomerase n=1 Tax=bacterium (Candidatus Blackallbacteria) CG17_big_fil_post_rev_8_21_14_2_50_48_46 TaxID=2014261 RepID=A0A2M7FY31_9BACT|nr:MAG: peptidylprolyl isomerase [bacterium (Candidatus Blackallbacteria) CG18_big_fil_WC_8_21_14_2_50_49_26]PIW14066.1 MAG: peptidylprolyl isomerase [bacterium (Candidatus Blackallbacteria) CG17_big_fil_post_rev_8_21_14_2_50_48_46]PIW46883.1 MAG: peptidylprolyl isomerase [bacterium (Candidatus Blackallbacteria) CG13_big_fil_rev_8_21_14_2_50_49_14]
MATGSGNQLADPYFVNFLDMDGPDDVYLTSDDGMRLSDTSPALGAGLAAGMPAADILGVARTSPPDAGAYQGGFTSILPPLLVQDLVVGTGPAVATGNAVTVNYIGTLTNGTEFDNSYTRGQPFSFTVGANQVIKGWEQGLIGMQAGGKRRLTIPPHLAYGSATVGIIPPDSTLIFEIELVSIP